jgi:primosomal protein N' (replication factor Y)
MMTQVSGRSGRSEKQGRVIIQTYNPDHNTIQQVTNNDLQGCIRNSYMTGKFINTHFKIIKITLKHRDFDKQEGSMWLYQVMTQNLIYRF